MARYVIARQKPPPHSWYDFGRDHDAPSQPLGQPNVYDPGPVKTGLVDKDGNEICRTQDRIGFVWREE